MFKKTLLAAVLLGLTATTVQADEVSGYATYSIGHAQADKPKAAKEVQNVFKEFGGETSSDRSSTGYKAVVGLRVNPNFAVEMQYIDLGSSSYKGSLTSPFNYVNGKVDLKTTGFGGNLVGFYPIDDFTVFAKVGYHALRTKSKYKLTSNIPGIYESDKKTINKWAPSIGIGASYSMTKELSIVAEYERYQGVANKKVNVDDEKSSLKHDIDFASLGLRYSF